jgi:uncharacterized protein YndB with AHSA1/START domain
MAEVVLRQRFEAPPERVFEALTDHVGFGRALGEDIRLERPGVPAPNGLGAVRAVHARGLVIREEVVGWEMPRAMDYRVISGAPLENHLGEIRFEPEGAGTRVHYRIRFDWPWYLGGALVGGLVARTLEKQIGAGIARIAASLR